MKIRYLIFLFLVSSAVIPSDAFGQLFPNFSFSSSTQGEPQNDGLVHTETVNSFNVFNPVTHTGTFQTHPDYLLDYTNYKGQQVFIPYNIDENDGYVNFESAHNSVTFYKNTCSVRVFNGEHILGDSVPLISSASFDLQYAENGTDTWIEHPANFQACSITHTISGNVITFDLVQSTSGDVTKDVEFIFNLEKQTSEVIPKVTNNDDNNLDTKYGWAIGLNGIKQIDLQGETVTQPITLIQNNNQNDLISIQGTTTTITIDPQNNVNHYLWATKISPDGIILDYKNAKNALPPGQTLAIDPSWTSGSGTSQGVRSTTGTTSCATASSKSSGDARVITPPTGDTANYCDLDTERWSITGFNKQWTATAITFQTNIAFSSGRDKTCAIMKETNDPNSATAATLQADIMSGSSYATAQNFCEQPNGGPFSSTLGGTSVSDFNSQTSLGWYAVGIKFDDQTKDHAHTDEADFSSTTLVVTYSWVPPAPITDTACSDNAINSISCSWSVPASPTTILGYYETLNQTLHAPLYDSSLKGYWKLDYNDPVSGIIDYSSSHNNGTITGGFVNKTGMIANAMNYSGYLTSTNQWIDLGNPSVLNFDYTQPFTFATWIKYPTGQGGQIIAKSHEAGGTEWDFTSSNGDIEGILCHTFGANCLYVKTANNLVNDNVWHYVTWSNDGTGTAAGQRFTIDGVSKAITINQNTLTLSILPNTFNVIVGGDGYQILHALTANFQLDDLRFYNKVLTVSQINQLFNYRIISTNSYTNTVVKYPFTYNVNVQGVSYNGMLNQYVGNTIQIAPYNVIDPPYQVKATLGSDTNGFFENVTFAKPKVANSICGSYCTPNGYQIQHYNTTTHSYQTDSANQTALFKVIRNLNQNTTQNIRLFTNNHAGLSARTFPLNETTYPQEVSHWMLQNNLIDTRNLNNGTLTGNWNFTSGRNGNAQVMGGSTYDVMGSSSIPVGTSDRTIITWIYPTAFTSNSNAYFSYGTASANAQFSLIDANGKIDCGGAGNNVNSTTTLTVNKWNMVSCVLSNTGQTRQIYLNATLDKSSTTTALNTASSANTYIGTRVDSTSHAVTSLIGDTRIFSSALTSQQITNIYNEAIASRQNFAGSLTLSKSVGGNDVALNGTITISGGFPTTNTLTKYNMKNGTTLLNNTNTSTSIGTVYHIPTVWEQGLSLTTPSSFKQSVLITSTASGTQNLTSNVVTTNGSYVPSYSATSGILWNYTLNRPSPYTKTTVTVNESPVTFSLDCQIRTNIQAVINSTGTHYNQSNVVFYQQNASSHDFDNLYGSCNDIPTGKQLFTFVSYGHTGNYITSGIAIFDQLGGFLGAPSVLIFILAILSWGTGRNFPMVIVIAISALGLMGAMGLLVLHQSLWAMIFVLAGLAIFGIRKFY